MLTADLRNLGERLAAVLDNLREAGVDVNVTYWPHDPILDLRLNPLKICDSCERLSPAAACLWCTPAEDDPGGHG